ncbi:aspartate/glutamate racemase family protein [Nonomuraea angiospora]|uniref:aspartate/glutamate racemase family protein n=1 Tax=Nonomuraea angiospora TaxID=46172 RepID=UPI0029A0DC87|nr:aspartate/glutamate racemase family protein [Nonomuraea angiospora]MDX3102712.1 aspartate/glutamate racemase family protein [Nonomuraea angiospora]
MNPTIAVVNATPASMRPAADGLGEGFPEARPWHLLDDRLVTEADAAGGMTPALTRRMLALIDYAVRGGADAVLLSCSMYGPAAALARRSHEVPVTGSDEAMFAEVTRRRPGTVLVLGSLASAAADSARRLKEVAGGVEVRAIAAPGAAAAAGAGDWPELTDALARAAAPGLDGVELVLLGQYSISPVRAELADRLGLPVLSPPLAAARALREALA